MMKKLMAAQEVILVIAWYQQPRVHSQ